MSKQRPFVYWTLLNGLREISRDCYAILGWDHKAPPSENLRSLASWGAWISDDGAAVTCPALQKRLRQLSDALGSIPPQPLSDLSALEGGKPWDLLVRRTLDSIAKPIPEFNSFWGIDIDPNWTHSIARTWPDLLADIERYCADLEAIRGRRYRAAEPQRPKRRRRKTDAAPRPLTAKQVEAVQIVGECKGNIVQAAARMGISPRTTRQHYEAGIQKLGRKAVKHGTQRLPSDKRGQDNITSDDDRRRG